MGRLHGSLIVVVLAAVAPPASGRGVLAQVNAARPGRAPPPTLPTQWRGGDIERSERLIGQEDERALEGVDQAVRISSLVVEATAGRCMFPSSRADFGDGIVLKGSAEEGALVVDLRRAPVSRWPSKGERRILCLARKPEGHYELASYHACILPATRSVRAEVLKWSRRCQPPKAPDPFIEATAAADTILVGTLTNVAPSHGDARAGEGAFTGIFAADEALLGYADFGGPVMVRFPASRAGRGARCSRAGPSAGWYLLFARGDATGEALVVVDAVRLIDARARGDAVQRARAALGSRRGRLTTIQAALAEYERSWNDRDADRVVRCHSRTSLVRQRYVSDADARRRLTRQLEKFSGRMGLALLRAKTPGAPQLGRPTNAATASAEVAVTIHCEGSRDRLLARMELVREDGEWLIASDGF